MSASCLFGRIPYLGRYRHTSSDHLHNGKLESRRKQCRGNKNYGIKYIQIPLNSPLDDPGKKKIRCTPRGTKVVIYHLVGNFMLNSMQNVVSLATCAESL